VAFVALSPADAFDNAANSVLTPDGVDVSRRIHSASSVSGTGQQILLQLVATDKMGLRLRLAFFGKEWFATVDSL
jgi:hypothetical protein